MTGNDESGHDGLEWESEPGEASDARSTPGAEVADPGSVDAPASSEEDVVDELLEEGGVTTEIIDGTAPELDAVAATMAQRDEYLDSLRRLQADFENYKKRVANQQADQLARAASGLVDKLLPVLDTLDLAVQHLGDAESPDAKALVAATSQLQGVLAKEGLDRIDPLGEEFDPTAHEAVGQLPAEVAADGDAAGVGLTGDEAGVVAPSGAPLVAQVMRPGYRWKGTVLRPAMVMVRG